MNHAPGAIAPPDAEVVQVGDIIWQRVERGCLVQGTVRPVGVVEVLVLTQHDHQVPLIPHQGPVQQLAAAAADPVGAENPVTPCDLGIRVSGRRAGPGALDTRFSTTLFQPGLTLGTLLPSDTGSSAPPSTPSHVHYADPRLPGKARKPGVLAGSWRPAAVQSQT